jgi:putative endopeptidase
MIRRLLCAAATAALLPTLALAEDVTQAPRYGAWGFDLGSRDMSVKPGDDFYRYAQGKALDTLEIPADRSRFGSFDKLRELSEARSKAVIDRAAAKAGASGEEARIGALYKSFMDEAAVEALGAKPLARDLAAIRAADSRTALAALMGKVNTTFGTAMFGPYITTDAKKTTAYAVHITQAGLSLPDRDYYLQPSFAPQKEKYEAYVAETLARIGWPDPAANAKAILAMETEIAGASWTRAERRDDTRTYNPMSVAELGKYAPGFDWTTFLASAELGGVQRVILDENTAIPKIAAVFAKTPVPVLQAWLAFNLADNASPYLSKAFDEAHFQFRDKTLAGTPEQRPRWKRGVQLVDDQLGEAVGRLYVATYFPPESKAKMEALVGGLRAAMAARIQKLDWMSDATKKEAQAKLAKFTVKVGYPVKWRDYSALEISPTDLYGNVERAISFEWRRQVRRLNGPVDKTEWGMTPQTVNAYYSQTENEIVFPAAILQPPFFDPNADMAVNYGAIGGVIGHEMTHGFDDQGRHSDGDGILRDWWTKDDDAKFNDKAKAFGAEYAAFDVLPGAKINPELTMGENIADLGGLTLALDAYHASLGGKAAPVIDGLTGDQRVFLGWTQVWRSKTREDRMRQRLVSDPHSPEAARAGVPVRNIDAWYDAFGIKPGDKLYIAPEQRVRIW